MQNVGKSEEKEYFKIQRGIFHNILGRIHQFQDFLSHKSCDNKLRQSYDGTQHNGGGNGFFDGGKIFCSELLGGDDGKTS